MGNSHPSFSSNYSGDTVLAGVTTWQKDGIWDGNIGPGLVWLQSSRHVRVRVVMFWERYAWYVSMGHVGGRHWHRDLKMCEHADPEIRSGRHCHSGLFWEAVWIVVSQKPDMHGAWWRWLMLHYPNIGTVQWIDSLPDIKWQKRCLEWEVLGSGS